MRLTWKRADSTLKYRSVGDIGSSLFGGPTFINPCPAINYHKIS